MKTLRLLLAAALILTPFSQALAGAGTVTTKDAAGLTRTFVVVTDGSGNFVAPMVVCDATAAATCATVDASGLAVKATITGTVPLPSGASTAAGQTTINTTLGSPFQAGGSIGNTTFAATQATAANLNATVVGTGTFATQLTGATNNINNIAGTISLPTGAATSALQTTGNTSLSSIDTKVPALGQALAAASVPVILPAATITTLTPPTTVTANLGTIAGVATQTTLASIDTKMPALGQALAAASVPVILPSATITTLTPPTTVTVTQGTAANLNMTCANCSGSGASGTDGGGFTAGSSVFAPGGGFFQTTATNNALADGKWGAWQLTATRAGFVNLRNAAGAEAGVAAVPLQMSLANTGANSTAVKVDNSAVTQPISGTVTANAGTGNFTVVNGGTFAVQPASGTAPVSTMNSASANAGVNSAMAAVFDDTSPTAITENSFGFVRMSANRNQYTTIRDGAGNERGVNVNANNALLAAIDQTTPGTTNGVQLPTTTNGGAAVVKGGVGVVNGGSNYETVAASQTAQAMGATGATGDYLSHCVIYPATTSPGVVTVFDNTNAAGTNVIAFAGGATSVSNLTPIAVAVGAVSTAGAWKVTTGANVSAVCYGRFT